MRSESRANVLSAIVYWGAILGSIVYFGWMFIGIGVAFGYHPMSARAHVGFAWFGLFPLLACAAIIAVGALTWRGTAFSRRRGRLIGTLALVAITGTHYLSLFVETGYRQSYWLGEVRHDIPWRYSPYNGSSEPGGTYFLVMVTPDNFTPRYEARNADTISLIKATDFEFGTRQEAPPETCRTEYGEIRCSERRGRFVYGIAGKAEQLPPNPASLLVDVQSLLDSFEAKY